MQAIMGTVIKTGAIALTLALAGCGGGSSTPAAADPVAGAPVAPVAQRSVQGTAAKGLIKGAKVSVYEIDAQGVRAATALATATTGSDGRYTLQIPVSARNFVIEVSAAPGATMADEATGSDLPLPESMKLRSIVTLADHANGAYEGTVSPLTEMVARTAQAADGKLPKLAVAEAKISVRTLLGFDPETVKPVNSNSAAAETASEDEKNQSLALAAISKMGTTASADCAQSTAGERISCVVNKFASSVTVKDGQPAFEQARLAQFQDAVRAVAQDKTINRTGKDKIVGIPVFNQAPGTVATPTPAAPPAQPAPALPPLAATKALFGSLRTNLHALNNGDAFRATADGIKADLDGFVAPLGNDVSSLASLSVNALEQLERYRSGASQAVKFDVWNNALFESVSTQTPPMYSGTGNCQILTSPLRMSCSVVHMELWTGYSNRNYSYSDFMLRTVTFQPKEGSLHDYSYITSFTTVTRTTDRNGAVVAISSPQLIAASGSGQMIYARTGNTITQVALKGRMPGRMIGHGGELRSDFEDWSLNVTRTDEADGIASYKFGGVFSATVAGQPAGQVEIDSASFLRVAVDANNKAVANAANELQVTLRGSIGSTAVDGTLRVSDDKADKSKTTHMPTKLSFNGSLKHKDATVFSGNVAIARTGYENFDATAAESATNFVADTVEIGGTLSVPNRPTLGLTLGVTRTGLDSADISAQYRDGTSVINASVTARLGDLRPLVKVASADGVAFSFSDTTTPVRVTKDGAVVAEIDLTKGIITYSDGSTESLI